MITPKIEFPSVEYLKNQNPFSGSAEGFNFKLFPQKETLLVKIWYGINYLDESELASEQEFPFDEEGTAAAFAWIEKQQADYCKKQQSSGVPDHNP